MVGDRPLSVRKERWLERDLLLRKDPGRDTVGLELPGVGLEEASQVGGGLGGSYWEKGCYDP